MATEAQLTQRELKKLRAKYPRAWVRKLNDGTTGGIPDAVFLEPEHVPLWIEFKVRRRPSETAESLLTPLQHREFSRIASTFQAVLVVVFDQVDKDLKVYLYLSVGLLHINAGHPYNVFQKEVK